MKRWNKNRINYIHFNFYSFMDYDNFVEELLEWLQDSVQYSLLIKIQYNKDLHGMIGEQIGFSYEKDYDIEGFKEIHNSLIDRLSYFCDDYEVEVINSIQLLFVRIEEMPELKIENFYRVKSKIFTNTKDVKSRFNIIPLTMDT